MPITARSAHSRTMSFFMFFKHRSYTGNNNNVIHTVHALSVTYGKGRLTGWGRLTGVVLSRIAIDRGGKNRGHLTGGGAIAEGAIDRTPTQVRRYIFLGSQICRHPTFLGSQPTATKFVMITHVDAD